MTEEASRVGEVDGGLEREFLRLAHVVQKGGGEQKIAVDAAVLLADEVAHLGHRDRVLHQAAQVGMVVELGGRSGGEDLEELGVAEESLQEGAVVAIVHRVDVELEEALQLLDVAIGGGQEVAGRGRARRRGRDPRGLQLRLALVFRDPGR